MGLFGNTMGCFGPGLLAFSLWCMLPDLLEAGDSSQPKPSGVDLWKELLQDSSSSSSSATRPAGRGSRKGFPLRGGSEGFFFVAKSFQPVGHHWNISFEAIPISGVRPVVKLWAQVPAGPRATHLTLELQDPRRGLGWFLLGSYPVKLPSARLSSLIVLDVSCLLVYWGELHDLLKGKGEWVNGQFPAGMVNHAILGDCVAAKSNMVTLMVASKHSTRPTMIRVAQMAGPAKSRTKRVKRESPGLEEEDVDSGQLSHDEGSCRRVNMVVDFNQIPWGKWVLAPKSFDAYRCQGTCSTPLQHSNNNYAMIMGLLHHLQPTSAVSTPSCVPIRMSPQNLIVTDEDHSMAIHYMEDMVVEECGCV
ncbi:nodal homolog [Tachyglossus aculeatus]|uniref:nodal homolog n=1 Tax=Tachyglossus aculeatus TaxID=9261 RepID=UPI0018F6936D|nr:nodal homolog [Tachyglossus aculeatus]